ncbi:glutathione S-transferase N-terminal domain-containing protein [Catenovulum sp. SM1970]|uniref:glutaredoxin family protein n=1 Tax=Marinifaba aquimaris TaxID=2741323 RepID=UPI0015742035|nr:glutaredoxin [Marinifaba aquimaris]NTS76411.1 glutathione S-transferase N-terminal domain-containing protein [Marinifaba aquimaris]
MKFIRWFLGNIILFFDFITTPRARKLSIEQKSAQDAITANFSLYQFKACPFCVKVRREIKRQNMQIDYKDAKGDEVARNELAEHGGKVKVPCLRIEKGDSVEWMYESNDIIAFLQKQAI